jgi:hypothetical protein
MQINTGIGVGEAQVFDTKNIVNAFYKIYQQKQKEDQLFAEKIADNLSKFDTTGLTGKDLERVTNMYDKLRTFNQNIDKLGRNEKTLLDAQIRKGMNEIKSFSANAKQFYKDRENFGIEYNKDKYSYLPEVQPLVDKVTTLSYGEALDENLGDVNVLRMKRAPDRRLIDDSLNDFAKVIKGLSDDSKPTSFTQDGVVSVYRTADPKAVEAAAFAILTDDSKKFAIADDFKRQNPNVPPPTDKDLVEFIKKSHEAKNGGPVKAYTFLTNSSMAPKAGEGKEPTEGEQYSGTLNNAFGANPNIRTQSIERIKAHSKGKIVDLVDNGDGTLTLTPYKTLSGIQYKGSPIPITSAGQLNSQLGSLGISSSGFGVIPKLSQAPVNKPSGGKIIVVMPNGTEGEIEASKWDAFKKKYPGAKRK